MFSLRKHLNYWVFLCASLFLLAFSSASRSTEYYLGNIQLRESANIEYNRHYNCFSRPEFDDLTQCNLVNYDFRNSNPLISADTLFKSSDGSVLLAYQVSLEFGEPDNVARNVISAMSGDMSGARPTALFLEDAVVAIWGDTRIEEISTLSNEYSEITGLIEQKYGLLMSTTGDVESAKGNRKPLYRVIGGDGLVAIISEFQPGQVIVQRFIVAAGTLVEKNFELRAHEFLKRDRTSPANDFSKWPEAAFMIRRLALSTTPENANRVVDRTFGSAGNRKYYSHIWAFLPTSVIKHLAKNVYMAIDVFGENTKFPEIRSKIIEQIEAAPNEPHSEFLLFTLGRFDEAVKFNPNSPIRTVILYAMAHSRLREAMSVVLMDIYRDSGRMTESHWELSLDGKNRLLSERDFFHGHAYDGIPHSKDEYNDKKPTLTQYLNYFNTFPEHYDSAPIIHKVGEFAALTDPLLPIFEAVAKDRDSPHSEDAGYFLAWLAYHRGNVDEALDRFGTVIGLIESSQWVANLDYAYRSLWQIKRIFRTLPLEDVFDRVQNSENLSPHPIVWLTVLTSFYQTHQHQVVLAGARRALRNFGVTIENFPVTTDPRRISAAYSKLQMSVGYGLEEIVYLYHSSREIIEIEKKLLELDRHSISSVEDELRELITKYALISDADLRKMRSDKTSKPLHKDLRQSLYLLNRSLELLPRSSAHSKFRQWLHYKRIRLLAQFDPIEVSRANQEFYNEFPRSMLLDDTMAEQVFAEAVIIGYMAKATETFNSLQQRYPDANALDNAHSWMAIGWSCKGRPDKAREIDLQIIRFFPLTRHARFARERIQNPQACSAMNRFYQWDYQAMLWRERNRIDTIQASLRGNGDSERPRATTPQRAPSTTGSLPRQSQLTEAQAKEMVSNLLELHTWPGQQAFEQLNSVYAGSVDYYGNITPLDEVMQDKKRYFERWPHREYRVLQDTLSADCSGGQECRISGLFDWFVRSAERNKDAEGTASFEYTIMARPPHQILRETSEVVDRR